MITMLAGLLVLVVLGQTQPVALDARLLLEEEAPLRDVALDGEGKMLFTLSMEGLLSAWNVEDGQRAWRRVDAELRALAWGEKWLLATHSIPTASTFDPRTGTPGQSVGFPIEGGIHGFVGDPRSRWVWVGHDKGLVRLTPDNVNGWSRRQLENGGVTTLALDAEGELLAAGGRDGSIRFANSKSANVDDKRVLVGSRGPITALAFGPRVLVAADEGPTVRVWNLATNKEKLVLGGIASEVRALAVASKTGWIATGDFNGTIALWDLAKGAELASWKEEGGGTILKLVFGAKKRLLAAIGSRVFVLELEGVK